jgi:hypothetical protein
MPLVERHAARMAEAGFSAGVLVVRPSDAQAVGRVPFPGGFRVALSAAPDTAGSLAIGLAALDAWDLAIVTPVDLLPASVATIGALVDAVRAGALAASPRDVTAGRGGHPVVVRPAALRVYDEARHSGIAPPPLRDALRTLGTGHRRIDVDDPHVVFDLDEPADVERATGAPPAFWS